MSQTRKFWLDTMLKITSPVLNALSRDRLGELMPVESKSSVEDRKNYTYLEAFGRIAAGIAPWLGAKGLSDEEEQLRLDYAAIMRKCIDICVDPSSKDYMNFSHGYQPIVDAAFLAQGILRAPEELWHPLSDVTKKRLVECMIKTRTRKPHRNNWLLFSAMIESFLHYVGCESWDPMRIDYALSKHMEWYKGDGWYGDGDEFHWDYYNSFVIQPMLTEILQEVGKEDKKWESMTGKVWERAAHYATHQEHLISPEGTYPLIGRSLTYRFGAFHLLATVAYNHRLEAGITPAQVRCALDAVIRRTMAHPGNFDDNGYLTVGVCGHQPKMGENYISTGSLYLCTTVFVPLGLSPDDEFWSAPDTPYTMQRLWSGENLECEHAL